MMKLMHSENAEVFGGSWLLNDVSYAADLVWDERISANFAASVVNWQY